MQQDWVIYFFLTASISLSLPQFITLFESGHVRLSSRYLQLFAALIVGSAFALAFQKNGLLVSLALLVFSYAISPIFRFQDRFLFASVCASAICLLICVRLL